MIVREEAASLASGVRVFGTAVIRVAPDMANIVVAVMRREDKPDDAFAAAREGARNVAQYLRSQDIQDFGSSQMTLAQEFSYANGVQRFAGYAARISFNIVLRAIDRAEQTIAGLVSAGANHLNQVAFQTSRLREVRADARRMAVAAARSKAELYCAAAGVTVGAVLSIDDANPDRVVPMRPEDMVRGHATPEPIDPDAVQVEAIDPGSIAVGAAVYIIYALGGPV